MERLRVDTSALGTIGDTLQGIANDFGAMEGLGADGQAAGHPGLADAISHFSREWGSAQSDMCEAVTALAAGFAMTAEGFGETDQGLADAVVAG